METGKLLQYFTICTENAPFFSWKTAWSLQYSEGVKSQPRSVWVKGDMRLVYVNCIWFSFTHISWGCMTIETGKLFQYFTTQKMHRLVVEDGSVHAVFWMLRGWWRKKSNWLILILPVKILKASVRPARSVCFLVRKGWVAVKAWPDNSLITYM